MISVEINSLRGRDWDILLSQFDDASIYQTAAYGSARWGEKNLENLSLVEDGQCVAVAQARRVRIPILGGGVAYISSGPAFQRRGAGCNVTTLARVLQAMRAHFVVENRCHLLVRPNLWTKPDADLRDVFLDSGFRRSERKEWTILLNLSASPEELRSGFRQTWRHTLVKAEKRGLELSLATDRDAFDEFLTVYEEMQGRKHFAEFTDIRGLRAMQALLPDPFKLRILHVRDKGETIAGIVWSAIGNTGVALLAATGARAVQYKISNLMWWKMVEWLKINGYCWCDLGGVSAERNPGGYVFKSGMGKTHGMEVQALGDFDAYAMNPGHILFRLGRWQRDMRLKTGMFIERVQNGPKEPAATLGPKTGNPS